VRIIEIPCFKNKKVKHLLKTHFLPIIPGSRGRPRKDELKF
jgi:hypothetical protein